jgi:hypothetical protein
MEQTSTSAAYPRDTAQQQEHRVKKIESKEFSKWLIVS